jgi:hypothetical protein
MTWNTSSVHRPETARHPEVLDRRDGPFGETVLRRHEGRYEIISNGVFLMDTSDGRSERLLVRAALDALASGAGPSSGSGSTPGSDPTTAATHPTVLIGGLGVGFSLAEAAASTIPRCGAITVVERDPAVIAWHTEGQRPLAATSEGTLDDPRVTLALADLLDHLRTTPLRYDALCLDIDNGPDWTVTDSNSGLYGTEGLTRLRERLAPGGVLAVWSAAASLPFAERLRGHFGTVEVHEIPVLVPRGVPDVVYLARREHG